MNWKQMTLQQQMKTFLQQPNCWADVVFVDAASMVVTPRKSKLMIS